MCAPIARASERERPLPRETRDAVAAALLQPHEGSPSHRAGHPLALARPPPRARSHDSTPTRSFAHRTATRPRATAPRAPAAAPTGLIPPHGRPRSTGGGQLPPARTGARAWRLHACTLDSRYLAKKARVRPPRRQQAPARPAAASPHLGDAERDVHGRGAAAHGGDLIAVGQHYREWHLGILGRLHLGVLARLPALEERDALRVPLGFRRPVGRARRGGLGGLGLALALDRQRRHLSGGLLGHFSARSTPPPLVTRRARIYSDDICWLQVCRSSGAPAALDHLIRLRHDWTVYPAQRPVAEHLATSIETRRGSRASWRPRRPS